MQSYFAAGRLPRRVVESLTSATSHVHDETMNQTAKSRFAIQSWDEKPYDEGDNLPKLTRASVTKTFTGDLEGEGRVEYLMMYRSNGSATFIGLERIVGRI